MKICLFLLMLSLMLPGAASAESAKTLCTTATRSITRVSVHDPSIVKDRETGTYYVFGSHLAAASSVDLVNWKRISGDYQNTINHPVYGNVVKNLAESFQWAGYMDGDCKTGLAVWAPDVHWDAAYQWEDGTVGAYLLYYSASSTWRRSCIGYAVSKTVSGPYTYVDTVLYSGITATGTADGNSTRDTGWYNDYLNFNELLALGSENGGIDEINPSWFKNNGSEYNTNLAPNCIDPTITEDKDGNLWLVYGSWSGGLFLLEIDPATGAVRYPGVDGTDEVSGNRIDRYYGIHLAGGNHQSGEGPYIVWDAEAGYYFLYETYGGLTASGGYNMRLFRSESITGPYVDAAGSPATKNNMNNASYGIKLIGNYCLEGQRGYRSAGHNSALIDDDGSRYLVYHQRFDEGTEYHEVRVRQQFLNEDNWPVCAVYENRNETIEHYAAEELTGTYELINHLTNNGTTMLKNQTVTLAADGTVSGDLTGTWAQSDSGKGYDWLTITTDKGVTYKGFFFRQLDESLQPTMTFSCIGSNNCCLWGNMEQGE